MSLRGLDQNQLVSSLRESVVQEKKATSQVLRHLEEIEARKLYVKLGYDSLFTFLTREKLYSDSEASIRVAAMRLIKRTPKARKKLENNEINLTNAAATQRFLRDEEKGTGKKTTCANVNLLLDAISEKSSRETKKLLDKQRKVPPAYRYVQLKIDKTLEAKIDKVHKLLDNSMSEATLFEHLLDLKIAQLTKPKKRQATDKNKRYIPESVKRQVRRRSGNRCEWRSGENAARCNGTYRLEFDHRLPFSKCGSNELGNIEHLCMQHNRFKSNRVG